MYHTTLLDVQEEGLSLLQAGYVSMHLYIARAGGPMFASLHCTERVDPNA